MPMSPNVKSDPISRLKDACLSFGLFHLVVRRYFGYNCPESKLDKTRDLVLHGLLRTEQDYRRAFQVIEVVELELAFLHDFFFTGQIGTVLCPFNRHHTWHYRGGHMVSY